MTDSRRRRRVDLEQHELLHLPRARGSVVSVDRGVVWLTEHRDPRDIVLFAGDTWMVEHGGLTLLQAQSAATVTISGPAAARAHLHNRQSSRWSALARWLMRNLSPMIEARQPRYY